MEYCKLFCNERPVGKLGLEPEGSRMVICASMPAPGDGLYRVALIGERGEMSLGVMEPEGGELKLRRRPYRRDVASLGNILRGEAKRSFTFAGKSPWQRIQRPVELFASQWLRDALEHSGAALWRREQGMLRLAFPYDPQRAFPLETLFCFASIEKVEGTYRAVYTFDREECPQSLEKT